MGNPFILKIALSIRLEYGVSNEIDISIPLYPPNHSIDWALMAAILQENDFSIAFANIAAPRSFAAIVFMDLFVMTLRIYSTL